MKSIIRNRLVTILSLVLAVCMLFSVSALIGRTSAKAEYQTEIATQVEGASVRVAEYEKSGIKFKAQLKKDQFAELYNKYEGNVKAGMIIVPTDYITAAGGSTFTKLATLGKDISSATVDSYV